MKPISHVPEDRLEQYALGRLPKSDIPGVEEHLFICEHCRDQLDKVEDFAIGFRNVVKSDPGLARPAAAIDWFGWLRRPAYSMPVALVALILAIGVFSRNRVQFAPAVALQMSAVRGEMPVAIPAREFDLTLADGPREGGPFRVEVVGAAGQTMWNGLAESGPSGVQVKVMQRLAPGDYFVRIYADSGKVMREYGFHVRP